MDTSHSILRFAKRFFAGTLLSRISGAIRDMAMAFCFGASPLIAAFMVAYRLANLFRRLLGEGSLQSGFIPHFESLPEKEAFRFYRDTSYSMFVSLAAIVLGLEGLFWFFSQHANVEWVQIIHLAMWMTPGLIFICLYALNSALLQTQRSFFLPAAAPVLFNIAWIVVAFLARKTPIETAVYWLSCGIVVAFALQWAFTFFQVKWALSSQLSRFRPRLFSSEWKKLLKPLALGIVGIGAMQINTVFDALFSRIAEPSGPAFLWYALRVEQLPLALFGLALSRALLPSLSRAMREENVSHYRILLQESFAFATALMVPCAFALLALGPSGLNLLFGRGNFTSSDVVQTVHCLWGYGLGLIPSAFVLLLANGFYAKKRYGIPTIASIVAVFVNLILNAFFIFVFHWGVLSVAIATSLATVANGMVLFVYLRKEIGEVFPPAFWSYFSRFALAGGFAFGCTRGWEFLMRAEICRNFSGQVQEFLVAGAIYLGCFLGAIHLMGLWDHIAIFFKTNATRTHRPEGR